jgi:hypothetical protein
MRIIAAKRANDWSAWVDGSPERWACGPTAGDAAHQVKMQHAPDNTHLNTDLHVVETYLFTVADNV